MEIKAMFTRCLILATIAFAVLSEFTIDVMAVNSSDIYLDKLDKPLDDWWNALDAVCRGEPGGSEVSDLACEQLSAVR